MLVGNPGIDGACVTYSNVAMFQGLPSSHPHTNSPCNRHCIPMQPKAKPIPLHVGASHEPAVQVRSRSPDLVYPASHHKTHTWPWPLLPLHAVLIAMCWLPMPGSTGQGSPVQRAFIMISGGPPDSTGRLHFTKRDIPHQPQACSAIPLHTAAFHEPPTQVRSPDLVYPASHNSAHP